MLCEWCTTMQTNLFKKKNEKKKENDDSERKSVFLFCLSLVSGEFIYHSREQKEVYKDNSPYGYQGIFISGLFSSS